MLPKFNTKICSCCFSKLVTFYCQSDVVWINVIMSQVSSEFRGLTQSFVSETVCVGGEFNTVSGIPPSAPLSCLRYKLEVTQQLGIPVKIVSSS